MPKATRNHRLAWLATELAKGKSNSGVIMEYMTVFPGISEAVARKDFKELLQRMQEIELETLAEAKTRFMEQGWKLLEECRSLAQMGPAVNQFKTLATIAGVFNDKPGEDSKGNTGTPEAQAVRERIAKLMKDRKITDAAKEAGIDLSALRNPDGNKA